LEPRLRVDTLLYAVVALSTLALWRTIHPLAQYWRDVADYRHGFLIAGFSIGWLIWMRRTFRRQSLSPESTGLVLLLLLLLCWTIFCKAKSDLGQQILLPPIIWAAILATVGSAPARLALPPVLTLYFAIPVWDYAVPVLQRATIGVVQAALGSIGVPVEVDENRITIPEGSFQIIEGCSGIRYFIVALCAAYVAGAASRLPLRRHLLLMASAAVLALLANWLRVITVIYAGHVTQMKHYLVAVDHLAFGLLIFALLLIAVLAMAWALARTSSAVAEASKVQRRAGQRRPTFAAVCLPFALLTAASAVAADGSTHGAKAYQLGALPVLAERWSGPMPAQPAWLPHFPGCSDEVRAAYESDGEIIDVYLNVYGQQSNDRKLISYANDVLTPDQWRPVFRQSFWEKGWSVRADSPAEVISTTQTNERWLVSYVYAIDGVRTSNPLMAQIYYGAFSLHGDAPSGVMALATACSDSQCVSARESISKFWFAEGARLLALIPTSSARARDAVMLSPQRQQGEE
jgi:EpsI family protein